jgi:hypothetical protein
MCTFVDYSNGNCETGDEFITFMLKDGKCNFTIIIIFYTT